REPVTGGARVWRLRGQLHVTVAAKASFSMVPDGVVTPCATSPITRADLVPYRPKVDVTMTGHARIGGAPRAQVRLAIFRGDATLVDKFVRVLPLASDARADVPLVYERALGGPGWDDNPIGTGVVIGTAMPNLIDPSYARRAVCFAPIPASFPARDRLRRDVDLGALVAELPPDFDWSYFQEAP